LSEAALSKARDAGAKKVILYSSTKLETAITLYRRLGFREIPVDGPYQRSDIKMEIILKDFFNQ
jgi:GNAT superfamily N-acetyltransferase